MAKEQRWAKAQTYEKQWWNRRAETMDLEFYEAYASDLVHEFDGILELKRDTVILEIGSGAAGILTFLKSEHRYAIDPLEPFYSAIPNFVNFRDKGVKYFTGKSENLPFQENRFNFIIIDNVLDHCENIELVFFEISRVLQPAGFVYLRLSTYSLWGKFVRFLIELFQIDQGHPHTFTKKDLRRIFASSMFKVCKYKPQGHFYCWLKAVKSKEPKQLAKAMTFTTADKTMYILSNCLNNKS